MMSETSLLLAVLPSLAFENSSCIELLTIYRISLQTTAILWPSTRVLSLYFCLHSHHRYILLRCHQYQLLACLLPVAPPILRRLECQPLQS